MNLKLKLLIIFIAIQCKVVAQSASQATIAGTWKGTSLCQLKPSPCNDEVVVYHITQGSTDTLYNLQMNKVVNGKEEDMGSIQVTYNVANQTLIGNTKDRQGRIGIWLFRIDGEALHGSLIIQEQTLYRLIEVKRSK